MAAMRHMTIHFIDKTKLKLVFPKQDKSNDPSTLAANVKKALDNMDKIVAEVDGQLIIIPIRHVKHIVFSPAPDALPAGIIRNASIAE